ncbi:hypothetical protein BDP55DRAFT_688243 [Colletotrichum godetiae]|uniref:Uncharacterized protein n=1 Tax=Colletotrichum godetiae TaxID=1209918 RepID=A0AAJ0EPJ6_9PEZI|nr:uncharacterized protein BDP55DRAFT_688243 [Colletotrichum godetiae]KAK1656689.1 hypothetical protein BDP55DRAFT_688243 [Colletotrichum godetiae]
MEVSTRAVRALIAGAIFPDAERADVAPNGRRITKRGVRLYSHFILVCLSRVSSLTIV